MLFMIVVPLVFASLCLGVAGSGDLQGGSIPLLVIVLGIVGVPGETIGLILGVDRLLDMARTVPNVTGDLLTSLIVARRERLWVPSAAHKPSEVSEAALVKQPPFEGASEVAKSADRRVDAGAPIQESILT